MSVNQKIVGLARARVRRANIAHTLNVGRDKVYLVSRPSAQPGRTGA